MISMDQKTKIINFTARTFRVLVAVVFGYTIYDLFFRELLTRKIHIFFIYCHMANFVLSDYPQYHKNHHKNLSTGIFYWKV